MHAFIFDVDGTLVDSVDAHARAWHEAFLHFGFRVELPIIRSQIGKGGDQLMPVFLSPQELESKGTAIEKYRSDLWREKGLERVKPFSGVRELFTLAKALNATLAVASSAKAPELEHYLKIAQVLDLVSVKVSGDDVERSKPHPDIVHRALARLGTPRPATVWMIGDSPFDAQAARAAGVRAAGVRCGGFPEADLRKAGCEVIFDSPEEMVRALPSSPLAPSGSRRDARA